MSLRDDAVAESLLAERRQEILQKSQLQSYRAALKDRCWDVFMLQVELEEISDEVRIEIEGMSFTIIPEDPAMQSKLGLITVCDECGVDLIVPVHSMVELGFCLRAQQEKTLLCEACYSAEHRDDDDMPMQKPPVTSLERFIDVLQDVLVDYAMGQQSMLDDLRKLKKEDG